MKPRSLCLCFALLIAAVTRAQDTAPSPARAQLDGFLAAYNSADRAALVAFGRDHAPPGFTDDPVIDSTLRGRHDDGGLDVIEIQETEPLKVVGWFRTRGSDEIVQIDVRVDATEPQRITEILMSTGDLPQRFQPARAGGDPAAQAWHASLARRASRDLFSGAVYLGHGKQVLLREAFGFADREQRTPNTVDTRFRTGSLTEIFTAVVALRLAQEKRISLSDPLGKHLPELASKGLGLPTIEQYLTHTAGAGTLSDERHLAQLPALRSISDYLGVFGSDLLKLGPGDEFEYSDLGDLVLGAMIERVTARSYDDVLREKVFAPAGMTRTGAGSGREGQGGAIGYDRVGIDEVVHATDPLSHAPAAVRGVFSTVDDLARFVAALRSHKLLDARHTRMLLASRVLDDSGNRYGYGLVFQDRPNGHWIGHDSEGHDGSAEIWFSPTLTDVVIALSNTNSTSGANFVMDRLPKP